MQNVNRLFRMEVHTQKKNKQEIHERDMNRMNANFSPLTFTFSMVTIFINY